MWPGTSGRKRTAGHTEETGLYSVVSEEALVVFKERSDIRWETGKDGIVVREAETLETAAVDTWNEAIVAVM